MGTFKDHMAADMEVFFKPDEFADSAAYTPAAGGETVTVNGVMDAAYAGAMDGSVPVEALRPIFTCPEASVPNAGHEDQLVINDVTYLVVGIEPDGHGLVTLILERQ